MRARRITPSAAIAAVLLALVAGLLTPTAAQAASVPAQVGLVSFVGATKTPNRATLTVDWADVKGAKGYNVYASTSYDGVMKLTKPTMVVTGSKATLTGLYQGRDYFVTVQAYNAAGKGPRSTRVGHGTIIAEAKAGTTKALTMLTWNVCSNACSGIASRTTTINNRILELQPDLVALQEASKYTKKPTGYAFVVNGQNDIMVRYGSYATVKGKTATNGTATFPSKYTTAGKGVSWAALKDKNGKYVLVISAHLRTGTTKKEVAQRVYETQWLASFVANRTSVLNKYYGTLTNWKAAPVVILGDTNTNKSRTGDGTLSSLEKAGYYDAFDQAHKLTGQHYNTATPKMSLTPVVGITWGDHVDKVLVKPSKAVVVSWANAAKMKSGKYVGPLGSDHQPVLVSLILP